MAVVENADCALCLEVPAPEATIFSSASSSFHRSPGNSGKMPVLESVNRTTDEEYRTIYTLDIPITSQTRGSHSPNEAMLSQDFLKAYRVERGSYMEADMAVWRSVLHCWRSSGVMCGLRLLEVCRSAVKENEKNC